MNTVNFPACCTAIIINNFGESAVAEGGNKKYTEEQIEKYIKETVDLHRQFGKALAVVTTNSEQTVANKVLRKLKFKHSKWVSKKQHAETKVRIWYLELTN